ncbi:hypothetical protein [Pseudoalteromonas luteoviolacea]|uniref:Uncharacterized protein n=1 Tax=Pseudoalteromonas luteoviolacea H33 TaxID=1365251 RepID=A0A166ZNA9_9GAMM|nr:hypothetical protein [Pseudoalteromonas luteoviolacea]KZN44491.1 hypothetical protein N476_05705 [Pseudoalteromonas luteoviolacea H33]KZN78508.1 hypothetical protein N477_08895 [Pseudoalteromonas luteoviolacea H33-S]MBQ4878016.1 hypothetical protein [Pseudoalteromonas luteoviolacea]MBQ4907130.1 hypothetical protein [Pseudoalteromonas luteoviolacea]
MKIKVLTLMILSFLMLSAKARADWYSCYGNLWVTSNSTDIITEHTNRVTVFLPLKVQVSEQLLNCADEIWVEDVYYYSMVFEGPTQDKYAKLFDAQFKKIKVRNGIWKSPLNERTTQMWVRLRHYSLFPAGAYNGAIRVSIVKNNQIVEEQYFDMTYYSEPQVSISLDNNSQGKIAGSHGQYQINLGELKSNMRFYWGIKILSNSSYDIVLDSEFNGLRHETNTNALINYSVSFDNVKMSSADQIYRSYNFNPGVKNKWYGFEFILGNVELMPAGYYRDNLSLTVYPR